MSLSILGLDPSMSNLGIAWATYDFATGKLTVSAVETVSPVINQSKQVRQNSKDLDRARQLYKALSEAVKSADLICVEIPHGSQSSRAMASYGMCIGLLASISKPVIEVSARQVKAVTGNLQATKEQMIAWALEAHPDLPLSQWQGKVNVSKAEHQADAVAAIHAAMQTDLFKTLTLLKGNQA